MAIEDGGSCDDGEVVVAFGDRSYPGALRHVYAPPRRLHVRGRLAASPEALSMPSIAVVGARDATAYGLALARALGRGLAEAGIQVVSGLALGIDGAAHRGALDAGGVTVAVVGTGTDVVYPRQHRRLRIEILREGAVVSELPPGTPPRPGHFPQRNRIISGLSLGVVVVEATLRSGSLGTARHALEQGREVFAVPGPVGSARSQGPHSLLKRGARLVENVDDILVELPPGVLRPGSRAAAPAGLSPAAAGLLEAIRGGAPTVDAMAARTGSKVPEILNDLLLLELRGLVARGPGGRYAALAVATASGTAHAGRGVDSPRDER
ncbi:MAG: DNA-processing protein DprA [Thermodesulfobacteriota bacterium]